MIRKLKTRVSKKLYRRKSLWQLERDGLTQSMIKLFRSCPHHFLLNYCEGWTPKKYRSAIEFGSAFHDVLASIQTDAAHATGRTSSSKPHANGKARSAKVKMTPQQHLDFYYEKLKKQRNMGGYELEQFEETMGLVQCVLHPYLEFYKGKDDNRVYLKREENFKVDYRFLVGQSVPLLGRWDGIFHDAVLSDSEPPDFQTPEYALLETKTKSRIDESGIAGSLVVDFQTMFYCLAAEIGLGIKLRRICYDVIRRPDLYRRKEESLSDYLARTKADIEKRGMTSGSHYFKRWNVTLLPEDINNFRKRQLDPMLIRIAEWHAADSILRYEDSPRLTKGLTAAQKVLVSYDPFNNPHHYLNDDALQSKYGRSEFFDAICHGDYSGLYRRNKINQELV